MEKNISFSSDPTKGFIIYFFSLYVHIYTKRALCIFIINPSKVIIAITILEASIIDSNNFSSLSLSEKFFDLFPSFVVNDDGRNNKSRV